LREESASRHRNITRYEKGDQPGRATTLNICREFNVNEKWLTSGKPKSKSTLVLGQSARRKPPVRKTAIAKSKAWRHGITIL
jgi:hypothetical protein